MSNDDQIPVEIHYHVDNRKRRGFTPIIVVQYDGTTIEFTANQQLTRRDATVVVRHIVAGTHKILEKFGKKQLTELPLELLTEQMDG